MLQVASVFLAPYHQGDLHVRPIRCASSNQCSSAPSLQIARHCWVNAAFQAHSVYRGVPLYYCSSPSEALLTVPDPPPPVRSNQDTDVGATVTQASKLQHDLVWNRCRRPARRSLLFCSPFGTCSTVTLSRGRLVYLFLFFCFHWFTTRQRSHGVMRVSWQGTTSRGTLP